MEKSPGLKIYLFLENVKGEKENLVWEPVLPSWSFLLISSAKVGMAKDKKERKYKKLPSTQLR